jgi:asparagine synthetase B (glutamine-hydrolysing)
MYLELAEADSWNEMRITLQEKLQKDYDYYEKENIEVFIYGYPYHEAKVSWLSASDLHQTYLEYGTDFIDEIEGCYTIIILDKIKEKCFVIADRYGVYTLFYLRNHDHIILSDVIGEIITHMSDARLNWESIIEYLNYGFRLGNKTHIVDIYQFEPSRTYEINKGLEMTETVYWESQDKLEEDKMTKEEFLTTFNAHIDTAMSLSKKVCSPLTGGLDTRTILSACIPKKERLHCYTHGTKKASDVKLAQTICNHFDIRHSFYELNEEWIRNLPSMVEQNAEIFNGLIPSISYMHVEESLAKESGQGDLFISGRLGNEIWRCIFGGTTAGSTNMDDVSLILMKRLAGGFQIVTGVYHDYSDQEVIKLLKESVKTELLKGKNAKDSVALSEAFAFRSYCFNWASNSLKVEGKHFKLFAAYLHKDLLQQLSLISLTEKTKGSIQKRIITKNDSYLANLPFELDTGRIVTGNLSQKLKGYISLFYLDFRYAVNMISRKIFKTDIFRIPYYTDYAGWLRSHHREFVLEVLSYEKMITKELFKKPELEKTVNSFLKGDNSLARFIIGLISLELWLRRVLAK